jgi:hypothetical protein
VRGRKKNCAFKHGILLRAEGHSLKQSKIRRSASLTWKQKALHVMRRRFYFQVLKAHVKLKYRWGNYYCITRIGAPGVKEFLCRETFYVAQISKKEDAVKFREYWYWCRRRSFEILEWLWNLRAEDYCWKLHMYLKGFIVTKRPIMSEVDRYESKGSEKILRQILRTRRAFIDTGASEKAFESLQRSSFK